MLQEQIERLWSSLLTLGSRRLIALGVIGVSVFAMTGLAGYFLSRPAMEILYAGLDRQDVGKIAAARARRLTTVDEYGVTFRIYIEWNIGFSEGRARKNC